MINYIEKGYGLHQWLAAQGIELRNVDGAWIANVPDEQINQLIADYNPWPTEKAAKFAEIDADFESATAALTAGWPQHEIQTGTNRNLKPERFQPILMRKHRCFQLSRQLAGSQRQS